tara:strand:- start:1173 stop:1346 length:174 start_codon:yes stop_codon:yes gene_type:complete
MGEVITYEDFERKKVDWYVQMWKYGKHDDAVFAHNMERIGFDKKDIQECLNAYHDGD